jgi:uncharacterized protein (DUF2384 family)
LVRSDLASEHWLTRDVVAMSGAHLEALMKCVASYRFASLGALVRRVKKSNVLRSEQEAQLTKFANIANAAKHVFGASRTGHMFSYRDAMLAYFVARRLAVDLYDQAGIVRFWEAGPS